ncbi:MAG TPA: PEP/pyruvate-binding domain-containing protein, partial [Rudaea sp.]|nr:PEP/pyruvate-binding domain-containing protein [Rudaea sp.]
MSDLILWLDELRLSDLGKVGGKNASLGEMIGNLAKLGVSVPGGFATTADAFKQFIAQSGLAERVRKKLAALDVDDVAALTKAGAEIRQWVIDTPLIPEFDGAVRTAYQILCDTAGVNDTAVAVRSSATAEDLPDASFAGQQETFLNVCGADDVIHKVKEVFASLYNDRAIAYRVHHGFAHEDVFLSAGVQLMVRSDIGASGVLFTLDTESGFRDAVFITASYGLGEMVVQCAARQVPRSGWWQPATQTSLRCRCGSWWIRRSPARLSRATTRWMAHARLTSRLTDCWSIKNAWSAAVRPSRPPCSNALSPRAFSRGAGRPLAPCRQCWSR